MFSATAPPTCASHRCPTCQSDLKIKDETIDGIVPSYGHRKIGDLVAVTDSEGFVEVAVVNGSAARQLGVQLDDPVEVIFHD
jgi:S-adenosylmethionine hydrolase